MPGAPDADLALLIDAAQEAGACALSYFKQAPEVWEKPGGLGPVSAADLAVDRLLHTRLTDARPQYGWLSEETPDDLARLSSRQCFIADPIDGTRAYLAGQPDFAISLAIVEEGKASHGVIYLPVHDRLFYAKRGCGAYEGPSRLAVSSRHVIEYARFLASKAHLERRAWRLSPPPVKRGFRSSIAYRLALIANGAYDGVFIDRVSYEWDIAAGALLIEEAGGKITTLDGQPLRFNATPPMLNGILGANPLLWEAFWHYL